MTLFSAAGDIIKTTLSKARENNKVNCSKTMVQALILKFKEMKAQEEDAVNRGSVEFHSLKELAKRLRYFFADPAKSMTGSWSLAACRCNLSFLWK